MAALSSSKQVWFSHNPVTKFPLDPIASAEFLWVSAQYYVLPFVMDGTNQFQSWTETIG
jgi:hypothetical protein